MATALKASTRLLQHSDIHSVSFFRLFISIRRTFFQSFNAYNCFLIPVFCRIIVFPDHIYGENSTTQELFDQVAKPIVQKSVQGFNGTIFAYGQTSSGEHLANTDSKGDMTFSPSLVLTHSVDFQARRTRCWVTRRIRASFG